MEETRAGSDEKGTKKGATWHNFNREHKLILLLGGFYLAKEPRVFFLLNRILLCCVFSLYFFLLAMTVITVLVLPQERVVVAQAVQNLCLLLAVIIMPLIKLASADSLEKALRLIRAGFHAYKEPRDPAHFVILSSRTRQIRYLDSLVVRLSFCSALSNALFIPLMNLLTGTSYTSDSALNPYLPLPIYMPFDTTSTSGFVVALSCNLVYLAFSYNTIISFVTTYLSCTLQLIAQLEILNYSLKNLDKRAYLQLLKTSAPLEGMSARMMKNMMEYQTCLYMCLRENIQHHQTIIR